MNKYYLYVDRETTRIYIKDNDEFKIVVFLNGLDYLNNYLTIDYDNGTLHLDSKNRAYDTNTFNVFESYSNICGWTVNAYYKMYIYLLSIIELLRDDNCEIMIIYSTSVLESIDELLNDNDEYSFEITWYNIVNRINEVCKTKIKLLKAIWENHLLVGFTRFLMGSSKEFIYIDDKIASYFKVNKKSDLQLVGNWYKSAEMTHNIFNRNKTKFFDDEENYVSGESSNNIKQYILHNIDNGNTITNLEIFRRDKRINIDCSNIINIKEKEMDLAYANLKELIDESVQNDGITVLFNIEEKNVLNRVKEMFNHIDYNIYDKFSSEDILKKLLIFSDIINKYSTILNQKKLKDTCRKEGRDYYKYAANKYLFLFAHILKQKEIDNICKELDIKSFKAYI